MIATLLTAFLALQGLPLAAQQGGTIAGILRNAEGRPAVGVRISALSRPESQVEAISGADLISIAETDEQGRFRLEDVPPGQYYVVAGRVDAPTYYPGTPQMAMATVIKVTAGATIAGLDFAMGNNSIRTEGTDIFRAAAVSKSVPIRVVTEDGAKIPVNSAAGPVMLQIERTTDGDTKTVPITATSAILQVLVANRNDFKITVQNLPDAYAVKSITIGNLDITNDIWRGITEQYATLSPIAVTLATQPVAASPASGVRVTGINRPRDSHPIYMSGTQAILLADGTFEFRNVPPGRHTIATLDYPGKTRGATIVVGDKDLENVTLDDVSNTPADIQLRRSPAPGGDKPPGAKLPLVTLRGRVLEEKTKQAPYSGQVFLSGQDGPNYDLDDEGKFVIPNLLPGVYNLQILIFGYATIEQEFTVGIEDMNVELTSRKLY